MVHGIIINKGEAYYTYLKKLFEAIDNIQLNYKWLISYPQCYPCDKETSELLNGDYCILTGREFTDLVDKEDFQWIWGTFSAFDPSISDDKILNYKLPENDMYPGFWMNPLTMQHVLSKIEIVAFDSSCTLLLAKDLILPDTFYDFYPKAENFELYNSTHQST